MGNRAVITTAPFSTSKVGVYLHWNGGRASVEAFLRVCRDLEFPAPSGDDSYAWARLCQVVGTYFKGGHSVGVGICKNLDYDNFDNGTYLVGKDWEIVGRKFFEGGEEINQQKTDDIYDDLIKELKREAVPA